MTITVQQFRTDYPEFGSTAAFPNSAVTFWLGIAYQLLNPNRWGTTLDIGAELFVAHHLTIEARAQQETAKGGIPGQQVGPINSKSVDKVSVGYDTGAGIELNAGHWNLSVFGTRFIRLAKMFGAGPLQVGIGDTPSLNGPAWSGPYVPPSITGFG